MYSGSASETKKQSLRNLFAVILRDFDSHDGAFVRINYNSPWLIATDFWSERSGYTVKQIRNMITDVRVADTTGCELDADTKEVFKNFQKSVHEWRLETGYHNSPLQLNTSEVRFKNSKEAREYLIKAAPQVGLEHTSVEFDAGDLVFTGFLTDQFENRVSISMAIKCRYGGKIWFRFKFPYYGPGDPSFFDQNHFNALSLRNNLDLPDMPELEWTISKSKGNFQEIGTVLSIIQAISSYLRPTLH